MRRLAVREGDEVKAGDTLLQLSLGTVGASSEDMQIRIDAMQMSKLRLKAEIENQVDVATDASLKVVLKMFDVQGTQVAPANFILELVFASLAYGSPAA